MPVLLTVALAVGEKEAEGVGVRLTVPLLLPELLALAPVLKEAVGEPDTLLLRLTVHAGVSEPVPVGLTVAAALGVTVPVLEGEVVALMETVLD